VLLGAERALGGRGPRRDARKPHGLGARLGRPPSSRWRYRASSGAEFHRLRGDRIRLHGATGLPGAARVRIRATVLRSPAGRCKAIRSPSSCIPASARRQRRASVRAKVRVRFCLSAPRPLGGRPDITVLPGDAPTPAQRPRELAFPRASRPSSRVQRALVGRGPRRGPPRGSSLRETAARHGAHRRGAGVLGRLARGAVSSGDRGPIDYLMMDYLAKSQCPSCRSRSRAIRPLGMRRDFIPLMERILRSSRSGGSRSRPTPEA